MKKKNEKKSLQSLEARLAEKLGPKLDETELTRVVGGSVRPSCDPDSMKAN